MPREFSNAVINNLIQGSSWTREIPFRALKQAMPEKVAPTLTSEDGRCPPVFDLWNHQSQQLATVRVSRQDRNPRNCKITTGTDRHFEGVMEAINAGLSIPVICFNQDRLENWYRILFDAGELVRMHAPKRASTVQNYPVTVSTDHRRSGGWYKSYEVLRVNFAPAGLEWEPIPEPNLPQEFLESGRTL